MIHLTWIIGVILVVADTALYCLTPFPQRSRWYFQLPVGGLIAFAVYRWTRRR